MQRPLRGEGSLANLVLSFLWKGPQTTREDSKLLQQAAQEAHLEEHGKVHLETLLFHNIDACITKVGHSDFLKKMFALRS